MIVTRKQSMSCMMLFGKIFIPDMLMLLCLVMDVVDKKFERYQMLPYLGSFKVNNGEKTTK